ncbi:GMP synthase-like glutamine amidotransferase [Microbacteriaceae bacterium MWH-Ta3]|nr:GMP synthase-like glutamine amidotransferase [Microbacteriaceae bacterium MWH-Ta3]
MKALLIEHDHVSPAGFVGERLRERGFEVDERIVVTGDNFHSPNVDFDFPALDDYDLIIPMGSPWGAWDDDCIGRWLTPEIEWIRQAVSSGKPVLGICFGGQLIARAMGGSVAPGRKGEIGWTAIWSDRPDLVSNGPWFEFHYDHWQVPPGATEIARNPVSSQAFVINRSLAVQFHPEVSYDSLHGWLEWGGDAKVIEDGQDPLVMEAQTRAEEPAARLRTFALVDAFLDQIAQLPAR